MDAARLSTVSTAHCRRLIAVSDIHGDAKTFRRLLDDIGYAPGDALVVAGDFLERGVENLAMLRMMIELSRQPDVHALLGNNDDYVLRMLRGGFEWDTILWFLKNRRATTLGDMAAEMDIDLLSITDKAGALRAIEREYRAELDWLGALPHIVDTEHITFAHAGLAMAPLDKQNIQDCIKNDAFAEQNVSFDRLLVVGHWPTDNYRNAKMDHSPYLLRERNVLSIDGGNSLRRSGQINACIWTYGDPLCYETVAADALPVGIALDRQKASDTSFNIHFRENHVERIATEGDAVVCYHPHSGRTLRIPANMLYEQAGALRCVSYTDYSPPIEKGDSLSVVQRFENRWFVKKDGVAGWYAGALDMPT